MEDEARQIVAEVISRIERGEVSPEDAAFHIQEIERLDPDGYAKMACIFDGIKTYLREGNRP